MARRRKIDATKVIEAVESGRLSKAVMDSYGLEKPTPPSGRRRGGAKRGEGSVTTVTSSVLADVTISKRGSLVLPKALVEELGFKLDDAFVARRTKVGIILKPV
jgi:hypothetical protein